MLTAQKTFGREVFEYNHTVNHLHLIILVIENDVLALSNSSASDYLVSWTSESSDTVTDDDIKYLISARNDPTVWAEGLEPTYQKFLSQVSASKLACLLSIL